MVQEISNRTTSRRKFMAGVCAAAAAPYFVPASALSSAARVGANDRLTVAHIGIGGMGGNHLSQSLKFREAGNVNIAALCDVDEQRLALAVKSVGAGATPYRDYRYILQRPDIDAVIIAAPDHWHAVMAVHACESGKHVYVEKPSSVTIADGRAMVLAARKHNRVVQVGSQARSAEPAWQACTYVRNGMLGRVHTVKCWHQLNPVGGTAPDSEPPAQLDWDLWLGPMRWRPHNTAYYHGSFRWVMESGGGQIRDRGAHVFSVIRWCLDADHQHPVTIHATGDPPPKGIWNCPPKMEVVYTFKDPDWTLIWSQPGEMKGNPDFGFVLYGDKDSLIVNRDGTRISAEEKARTFTVPAGGQTVYRMDKHADYNMNHKEDFFQAIRAGARPCMDIEAGHRAASLCILGNLSWVLGRKLDWDGANERVIDDECANRLLSQPQRHPYHL